MTRQKAGKTEKRKQNRNRPSLRNIYGENLLVFFQFVLLTQTILHAILYPVAVWSVSWVMKLCGFRYLTAENVMRFARQPVVIISVLVFVIVALLAELTWLSGVIFLVHQSALGIRTDLLQTVRFSLSQTVKTAGSRQRWILLLLAPSVLFIHAVRLFTLMRTFISESTWRKWLFRDRWIIGLIFAAALLLLIIFARWWYVVIAWETEAASVNAALRYSVTSDGWIPLKRILWSVLFQVLILLVYTAVIIILTLLIAGTGKLIGLDGAPVSSAAATVQACWFTACDAVSGPLIFTWITYSYERRRREEEASWPEDLRTPEEHRSKAAASSSPRRILLQRALILGSGIVLAGYVYLANKGRFQLHIEGLRTMQITAHRGASMQRPENTMSAFEEAANQGADWIELDVHESRDGKIFVMHDPNFWRTTGVDANVWEMDWEDIAKLDVGSSYSKEYAGERIPLLSEVLEFAKERGLMLNIELKPTGHEKALVKRVLNLVEEYEFEDQCIITSQSYQAVQNVRTWNPNVRTAYVSGLAYGSVSRMTAADAFSVQSVSISRSLVRNLHNRGIEVFAWTVDSRKNINRCINLGVDNIITNNVPLAIRCVNESRSGGLVSTLLRILNSL